VPQSPQKLSARSLPLSAFRVRDAGVPFSIVRLSAGIWKFSPNALDVRRWHSVQWQRYEISGSDVTL